MSPVRKVPQGPEACVDQAQVPWFKHVVHVLFFLLLAGFTHEERLGGDHYLDFRE